MTSSPRLQTTFPWFLFPGTFWSCKAGILGPMEVDLPQGKKACHCEASCGISKMSCGQVLVLPVTQQQGLARQRYNNVLSSGRLLGPSRAACDLKDCLMALSVRRVMCPQCLGPCHVHTWGHRGNHQPCRQAHIPEAAEHPQACSGWDISVHSTLVPPLPCPQATMADGASPDHGLCVSSPSVPICALKPLCRQQSPP